MKLSDSRQAEESLNRTLHLPASTVGNGSTKLSYRGKHFTVEEKKRRGSKAADNTASTAKTADSGQTNTTTKKKSAKEKQPMSKRQRKQQRLQMTLGKIPDPLTKKKRKGFVNLMVASIQREYKERTDKSYLMSHKKPKRKSNRLTSEHRYLGGFRTSCNPKLFKEPLWNEILTPTPGSGKKR